MGNKESNWKVGLVIGIVIIIFMGIWVGIVGHYAISNSNVSEDDMRSMNPVAMFVVLVLGCIGISLIICVKREESTEDNPVKR